LLKTLEASKNSDKKLEFELVEELESRIVEELESEPVEYEEVISKIQIKNSNEQSDTKPDKYNEYFSTFWIKDEEYWFDNEEIINQLQELQQNILEQLVSDDNDSNFTLESLDLLLKNKSDALWLRTSTLLKLQDLSLHVNDFICESIGCLQLSEEECAINDLLPNNNCNHNVFADDALVIARMNMKDSSKQLLLHNGKKPDSSTHIMMFTDIDSVVKPK
ncbi:37422_t:CDS:2, partial [Gigaspora margarita]